MQSYVSDVRNIASQPHEYSTFSSPTKSNIQALPFGSRESLTWIIH